MADADADTDDAEAEAETRAWTVSADEHGQRLDKVLVAHAGEFSRSHLQALIERGHVLLDGVPAGTASRKLKMGQAVAMALVPTAQSRSFRAEPMALQVVFEDEHLLVVDKPAGLVVHPAAGNWSGRPSNMPGPGWTAGAMRRANGCAIRWGLAWDSAAGGWCMCGCGVSRRPTRPRYVSPGRRRACPWRCSVAAMSGAPSSGRCGRCPSR
ncbi:MAG: S4 domain-containing protein, partial [Aquincola tertiaricarbonis]